MAKPIREDRNRELLAASIHRIVIRAHRSVVWLRPVSAAIPFQSGMSDSAISTARNVSAPFDRATPPSSAHLFLTAQLYPTLLLIDFLEIIGFDFDWGGTTKDIYFYCYEVRFGRYVKDDSLVVLEVTIDDRDKIAF